MVCWQGGGTGPLYVCEDHAKTLSLKEIGASHSGAPQVRRLDPASD
jgi:hypothetical protein